jgi:hypothetical protein
VKTASDYRKHALECRTLAKKVDQAAREQLLVMAATWDQLADQREKASRAASTGAAELPDISAGRRRSDDPTA